MQKKDSRPQRTVRARDWKYHGSLLRLHLEKESVICLGGRESALQPHTFEILGERRVLEYDGLHGMLNVI